MEVLEKLGGGWVTETDGPRWWLRSPNVVVVGPRVVGGAGGTTGESWSLWDWRRVILPMMNFF